MYPWTTCPRWDIEPKSELVVGLDSDVLAMSDYSNGLKQCLNYDVSGTLAHQAGLTLDEWKQLFEDANIEYPPKLYPTLYDGTMTPYYLNNGLVALRSEHVEGMREQTKRMLKIINKRHHDLFYIVQVATSLAIHKLNLNRQLISETFHQLETRDPNPSDQTVFFHYNGSKNRFDLLKKPVMLL
jgi:hypothetical protein